MSSCVSKSSLVFAFNVIKPFCVIIKEGWLSIVIFNTSWLALPWWVTRRLSITTPWLATLSGVQFSERCNAFCLDIFKPVKSIVPNVIVLLCKFENTVFSEDTTPTTTNVLLADDNLGKSKYIEFTSVPNVNSLLAKLLWSLFSFNVLLKTTSTFLVVELLVVASKYLTSPLVASSTLNVIFRLVDVEVSPGLRGTVPLESTLVVNILYNDLAPISSVYLIGLKQSFKKEKLVLSISLFKRDIGYAPVSSSSKLLLVVVLVLVCCFTVKFNACFGSLISLLKIDNVLLSVVVPDLLLYPVGPENVSSIFKPVP